jgi:hypothetical protein
MQQEQDMSHCERFFIMTLIFAICSGLMFTIQGGNPLGWAFGFCSAWCACGTFLSYLDGK